MTRSRASAKTAGTRFESLIAGAFAKYIDARIERRTRTGAKDRGDIAGLRTQLGDRIIAECKDYGGRVQVGPWLDEAETERINDDAAIGIVIFKRRGITDPLQQGVLMTVDNLITLLLAGDRP